ncbi:MAG: T9SS type A sorting domain-containing protein [Saprospiraceae bacterium]|nr:T9SS type A sorting domain-containing protein [Saprospiraceae bacterium]
MNFPMRILYRLMTGTALLALPYFSTAQVTKATDDYVQTSVNAAPITIRVLDNDSVRTGRRLKVDYLPLVNHGKAQITADSSAIEFTPDTDFKGVALVNYTIADGSSFDCGLVVIDVAATPTPNIQEMHLFTRKGKPVRFTIPNGFVNASTLQGATIEAVAGYAGVYDFVPNASLSGVFDLLFNKLENGVTKEFRVLVEVLNAPQKAQYLQDDYTTTPIGRVKYLDVLNNDTVYARAGIARVVVNQNGGSYYITRLGGNEKSGKFNIYPDANFSGSIRFDYTVTYTDGYEETATVHLTVSNYFPAKSEFTITAIARQSQVLPYKVPKDFVGEYEFNVPDPMTLSGGTIEFTNGQLVYTAPQGNATTDAFSLKYCIRSGGDCQAIDVKVNLLNARPCPTNDCVWLGDANTDGRIDMSDIFPLGDNIGQYGTNRTNRVTAWTPQSVNNWRPLSELPDPKHADTNGDGIVSASDTAAIMKYYGLANTIYPERTAEGMKIQTFLLSSATSIRPGDMIQILVLLGSADNPAIDTRGLSFSVDYSFQKIDEKSLVVDFGKFNWLSRYDAFLTASKIPSVGTVDAGIVRTLDRGASGHGQVGTIRAIVIEDLAGFHEGDKPVVRFKLRDAVMTDGRGHFTAAQGSEIVIPIAVSSKTTAVKEADLLMFPNPTSDFAEFYLNGNNTIQSIRVYDMRGREVSSVKNVNSKQARLDMTDLTNGLYMAEVMTEQGRVVKKMQVIK